MKFFYCKNQLTTRMQAGDGTSVFRSGQIALGICPHSLPVRIQAVDSKHSVIGWRSPDQYRSPAFSPYGRTDAFVDTIGFKGEPLDSTTENYLLGNGHRAYNPDSQRFNSPDSHSPFGLGGLNCYAFVGNDPINRHDPTGRFVGHANPLMGIAKSIISLKRKISEIFSPQTQIYGGRGREIDGIVAFSADSLSRGSSRVYIYAHGGPGYINGRTRSYDGPALYKLLGGNDIRLHGRETFLLSCRSAAVDPSSGLALNESLANNSGAASFGFLERVKVELDVDNGRYFAEVMPPELLEWYFVTHTNRPSKALPQSTASRGAMANNSRNRR